MTGLTVDPSVNGYIGAGYYTEQQQYSQQYTVQQQQQYNYEDYTHYPNPEDYLNERSRAYFPNGDHYAMPSKQRSRLDSDCKLLFFIISTHPNWRMLSRPTQKWRERMTSQK